MKTIFVDKEYRCHIENDVSMTEVQTDFFDGKCQTFVEGYRFVPEGKNWTREDGTVFKGEMIAPWKPYSELDAAQRQYERELAEAARILLGEVSA